MSHSCLSEGKKYFLRSFVMTFLVSLLLVSFGSISHAASYSGDWRDWRQKQSDYATMRSGGCRIVSYAKLIKSTGLVTDPNFNPDRLFEWCADNHKVVSRSDVNEYNPVGSTPPDYARKVLGKTITQHEFVKLTGDNEYRRKTIIEYSKRGYLVVLCSTAHFTYVDEERTRNSGELWVDDSGWGVQKCTTKAGGYYLTNYDKIRIFTAESPAPAVPQGNVMASGYNRTLPDGDYIIAAAGSPNYYLDIVGGDYPAANETNVALWHDDTLNISDFDAWTIKYDNGFYTITQKGTGKALDVYGADASRGANVQVYDANGTTAQKWAISLNGRNGYRLQAQCSGYSLDIENGTLSDGINVRQWEGNDDNAQSWVFIPFKPSQPISNGKYILTSAVSGKIELDVAGDTGNIPNATNVQIWDDSCPSRFNSFNVQKLDNGYYKLVHAASGKVLDLYGGTTNYQANICVYDDIGSLAQQWAIVRSGKGYALIPRCSGHAMDIANAATNNGTNVQQYPFYAGQSNQTWFFANAESTVKYNANGGTGAPSSQIKYYKNDLTLSTTVPKRNGYTFLGWSKTQNSGKAEFKPGAKYTGNSSITLYAQWKKNATKDNGKNSSGNKNASDSKQAQNVNKVETEVSHRVGDTHVDGSSDSLYTITSVDDANRTVKFEKVNTVAADIAIPSSVTIDAKEYKVTEIAANAFRNNKKLKKITIGSNIISIGKNAFNGCKNLKKVKIETTSLTKNTVGKNAFKNINAKAKVTVPKKSLKKYKKILKARGISKNTQKITK